MPYTVSSEDGGLCGHTHETIESARSCIDRTLRLETQPDLGRSLKVSWHDPTKPEMLIAPLPGTHVRVSWLHVFQCWQVQTKASVSEPFRPSCLLEEIRLNDVAMFGSPASMAVSGYVAQPDEKCDFSAVKREIVINF